MDSNKGDVLKIIRFLKNTDSSSVNNKYKIFKYQDFKEAS